MCQSLCNPVYLLACRNSVPGTYCRKFGWALWLMLEMHVAAQMDKINFANESSSFGFYTWKVTLKGTSKLCVCLWPFPSFFSPGLQVSCLTSSRWSKNTASKCSATSSRNALNSRSWDWPFLVCGPRRSPHRSLWEEASEKQPWQPEACEQTPGFHLECFVGAKIIGHRGQWLVISVPQGGNPTSVLWIVSSPAPQIYSSAFA